MKHQPIIISRSKLESQWESDSNTIDELAPEGRPWIIVLWPEHVSLPKFNGDPTYMERDTIEEALSDYPEALDLSDVRK